MIFTIHRTAGKETAGKETAGKEKAISLIPFYHFHPLNRQLDGRLLQIVHFCTQVVTGLEPGTLDFQAKLAKYQATHPYKFFKS